MLYSDLMLSIKGSIPWPIKDYDRWGLFPIFSQKKNNRSEKPLFIPIKMILKIKLKFSDDNIESHHNPTQK